MEKMEMDDMTLAESLPEWDEAGLLPPIWPGESGESLRRAPYPVSLVAFVEYFATSPERTRMLGGFLEFRKELHKLNIISGFQWVDGSFLEQIEAREDRAPRDIDIVTFCCLSAVENQRALSEKEKSLFNREQLKKDYSVDGHFVTLGNPLDALEVRLISYWYSMWAHCRDGLWKGFVQVDLSPMQDAEARRILKIAEGPDHE